MADENHDCMSLTSEVWIVLDMEAAAPAGALSLTTMVVATVTPLARRRSRRLLVSATSMDTSSASGNCDLIPSTKPALSNVAALPANSNVALTTSL